MKLPIYLSVLAITLASASCSAPATNLTTGEHDALATLDLALSVEATDGESIWPGFSLLEEPVLIHRPGGRSFLVGSPAAQGDVLSLPDLRHLPRIVEIPSGELHLSSSAVFSRDVPIRGAIAFMIRHTDGMNRLRFFRLLIHEIFHRYQQRHFAMDRNQPLCRYPVEDLELVAGALVEQRRLGRALTDQSDREAREGLRLYTANRLSRYDTVPAGLDAHTIEDYEERLEGTARYVEERYAVAAELLDEDAMLRRLSASLSRLAPKDLQKWRYYGTGQALLLLARRLLPEIPWQQSVDDGQAPFDVAFDAGGTPAVAPTPPDSKVLDAARRALSIPLVEHLEREQELLDQWSSQGTLHVILHVQSANAVTYSGRGVTFHLPDCSRFISRVTSLVDRAIGLEVLDRSLVLDGARERSEYRLEFFGDLQANDAIRLDGVVLSKETLGPHRFESALHVAGDRWRLDWRGPGLIEVTSDGLLIDLRSSGNEQ